MLSTFRTQVLYAAASRDAQLALELLRESRPDGTDSFSAYSDENQELRLEQAFVSMTADSDPKAALRMARESLSEGVTFGLLELLDRLRAKDSEAATSFARDIIAKLKGESLNADTEPAQVAVALLRTALAPQTSERFFNARPHRGVPQRSPSRSRSKTATCATF